MTLILYCSQQCFTNCSQSGSNAVVCVRWYLKKWGRTLMLLLLFTSNSRCDHDKGQPMSTQSSSSSRYISLLITSPPSLRKAVPARWPMQLILLLHLDITARQYEVPRNEPINHINN
jgi:hypothetical protein